MKFIRGKYPDGSIYASIEYEIKDYSSVNPIINVEQRINSYEDLWFVGCIKNALDNKRYMANLIIPSMWEQQADRRFDEGESFGLKQVCEFINSLNFEKVFVYHPHSDVTAALLNNCEILSPANFFINVLTDINTEPVIISPDAGAFKWVFKIFREQNVEIECGSKVREKNELINVVNRVDFGGKDVLIVDDICVNGGTFINIANIIKDRNIRNLYLAVSHMTVKKPRPELESLFHRIYTTNSKYDSYDLTNVKVLKYNEKIK